MSLPFLLTWLAARTGPRSAHGRPQPLLLPEPRLPFIRPARPGQPDRLRPLRHRRPAPPALLPHLQVPLLRTQEHPAVRLPPAARQAPGGPAAPRRRLRRPPDGAPGRRRQERRPPAGP